LVSLTKKVSIRSKKSELAALFEEIEEVPTCKILDFWEGTPGAGKTTEMIKQVNETKHKIGVFYKSHERIDEIEPEISCEHVHLEGFTRLCKKYQESEDFRDLHDELHLTADFLCAGCEYHTKGCEYQERIRKAKKKKTKAVLLPYPYADTMYIELLKIKIRIY